MYIYVCSLEVQLTEIKIRKLLRPYETNRAQNIHVLTTSRKNRPGPLDHKHTTFVADEQFSANPLDKCWNSTERQKNIRNYVWLICEPLRYILSSGWKHNIGEKDISSSAIMNFCTFWFDTRIIPKRLKFQLRNKRLGKAFTAKKEKEQKRTVRIIWYWGALV